MLAALTCIALAYGAGSSFLSPFSIPREVDKGSMNHHNNVKQNLQPLRAVRYVA